MKMEHETARNRYLKEFKRQNNMNDFGIPSEKNISKIGNQILDELKKEDLTHDEAYVCLQYIYNKIQYESNFLKLS